jgi:hypothetical protein
MYPRIVAADAILKRMTESNVLDKLTPPIVQVRPLDSSKFRAFQNGNTVNVASDEETPVVVHETGHYIEEKGGLQAWADIQKLMHQRHEAEGGGAALAGPAGSATARASWWRCRRTWRHSSWMRACRMNLRRRTSSDRRSSPPRLRWARRWTEAARRSAT